MGATQSCAWCKKPVHYRDDLDTDEKSVCNDCIEKICRDKDKGKELITNRVIQERK